MRWARASATVQYTRAQQAADQPAQAWLRHAPVHQAHQDAAIDPVKKLCEVDFHHDAEARTDLLLGMPVGLMG